MSAVKYAGAKRGAVFVCVCFFCFLLSLLIGSILIESEAMSENSSNNIINFSVFISVAISAGTISGKKMGKFIGEYAIYSCIWLALLIMICLLAADREEIFLKIQAFLMSGLTGIVFGTFVQFLRKGKRKGRRKKYRIYNS